MKAIAALVLILSTPMAFAGFGRHQGTPEQQRAASQWNRTHSPFVKMSRSWNVAKPFVEFETSGFVAITGDNAFELPDLREAIAKNLPSNATLVIFVGDRSEVPALKNLYSKYLGPDRLKFLIVPMNYYSNPIWGRDSLPVPVVMNQPPGATTPVYGLVDSIYPQNFEPDSAVAQALGQGMTKTNLYFRGGNLLADEDANCFSELASEVADLDDPESFFIQNFGCATVTILPRRGGIGDIDERIKFLGAMNVMTDEDSYVQTLTAKGYVVHKVPRTGANMETYMNSLLINGTVFVPQMGRANDAEALSAYRAMGFNAVGVYTRQLADQGNGNIHCVTMNYPLGTFTASPLGGDFIQFAQR